ncbi:hypothetical protein L6272_05545 [Microgenomates group bacterium]|nr:hypothetical protein [Microgenomates group bacterium]
MTKLKTITIIIVITVIFLKAPTSAWAVARMESDSYKLKFPNLNMTSGSKSSDNYNILDTVGQTAPGEYASSGFYVKAGFPYIKTIIPFSFTISDLSIDFGTLTPNVFPSPPPTNTLTVSFGGAGGYAVTANENHPLQLQGTATNIPDTNCDTSCSETTAAVWTNTAKYGFGYNMSGNDIPVAFINSTYYKQFADKSALETSQIVMSSNNVGKNRVATVTYKVNVSATQSAGNYANSLMFLATPTY